jgi:hypothetical protein
MLEFSLTIRKAKRQVKDVALQRCPDVRVFSRKGAIKISPGYLAFWIATKTDADAEMLRGDASFLPALRNALLAAGYPVDAVPYVRFPVESQETVDRDYNGNWNEAMEMP